MFKLLEGLLDKCSLNFTLSRKGDTLTVTVMPQAKEGSDNKNLSNIPFVVSGTADELEATFGNDVLDTMTKALEPLNNAEEFVKAAKDKEQQVKDDAKKKEESKTKTTAATDTKKFDPKNLKDKDKTSWTKIEGLIKKAENTKDVDMVSYLEKQARTEQGTMTDAHKIHVANHITDKFKAINEKLGSASSEKTDAEPLQLSGGDAGQGKDDKKDTAKSEPKTKRAPVKKEVIAPAATGADVTDDEENNEEENNTDVDPEADNIPSQTSEEEASSSAPPVGDDFF